MEIYIAKPCSEKLENMIPNQEGYFCQHCAKNVINFTKKTDTEIETYMEEAESPVCGIFLKTQLNRPLKTSWQEKTLEKYFTVRVQKKKSLWNSVYAMALYIVLLLSGCKAEESTAQNVEKPQQKQTLKKDSSVCVKDTINSALVAFGGNSSADYPNGINAFRKKIQQEIAKAKILEKDRVERITVQFTVNQEGKIENIVFMKNPPQKYIQEIIKDILYNKVEKFIPALNHKGEAVKVRRTVPIQLCYTN